MAGLRGERTILRQPQPTLHYTASLEEDTLGLKEAAQGWNRRKNLVLECAALSYQLVREPN